LKGQYGKEFGTIEKAQKKWDLGEGRNRGKENGKPVTLYYAGGKAW